MSGSAAMPTRKRSAGPASVIQLLGPDDLRRIVDRMAHQIIEYVGKSGVQAVLLGIPTRGVPLAHRLTARIAAFAGIDVPVGSLDVTLYRDDLRLRGVRPLGETVEPPGGGSSGRPSILVDDVLFSGRTVRAALDALAELGRPARYSSRCSSTVATASCRSAPTTSARTCRPRTRQSVRVSLVEIDGDRRRSRDRR